MPAPDPEKAQNQLTPTTQVPATSGTTLLPRPFASLVSLLTQSTSLSLRIGSFFGGVALDGARATTLTGLELSRAVIEGILTRAGRDVAIRSGDEHGRLEAESLLEKSVSDALSISQEKNSLSIYLNLVGNATYNCYLGFFFRCGDFSFLVDDAGVCDEFLSSALVDFGCYLGVD